ncbi:MAG: kynureninase [Phycisphaerae bacterium]
MTAYQPDEAFALSLDADDALQTYRQRFHIPEGPDHRQVIYFCGNSLGLQPTSVRDVIDQELNDWAGLGVDAHFDGNTPWYSYHEIFRDSGARLVGANPGEVVMMNSLTVNLHLMLVSFYRPTRQRYKILVDGPTFPSDTYAIKSQIMHHGLDPRSALIIVEPRAGEHSIRMEDLEEILDREGERIAVVMCAGVNFFTGQVMDMRRIVEAAHRAGCYVGFDLAHAVGNIPLHLHEWGADFAVWCNYKYVNSGPGAVAGCFVHKRHADRPDLPRFAGWWGNDPKTRFRMHLLADFMPQSGAAGWQVSNPPIMALAPLRASLAVFDEVGMPALRAKSVRLTGYLAYLVDLMASARYEVITPSNTEARGCQLSILVHDAPNKMFQELRACRVVGDFREPNVIRVAPVPLYNTFHEVWRFARILDGRTPFGRG